MGTNVKTYFVTVRKADGTQTQIPVTDNGSITNLAALSNHIHSGIGEDMKPIPIPGSATYTANYANSLIRDASNKLGDILSVKDFGAHTIDEVGFSTFDSTIAIQNCINAVGNLSGGIVYFPAGIYLLSSTLTMPRGNMVLIGAGSGYGYGGYHYEPNVTTLKFTSGLVGIDLTSKISCVLKGLKIDGNSVLNYGIDLRVFHIIEECWITGTNIAGIRGKQVNSTHIDKCEISGNNSIGLYVQHDPVPSTIFSVTRSNIQNNANIGISLEDGFGAKFENVVCEGNTIIALKINSVVGSWLGDIDFNNCWFENNGGATGYQAQISSDATLQVANISFNNSVFNCVGNQKAIYLANCANIKFYKGAIMAGTNINVNTIDVTGISTCFDGVGTGGTGAILDPGTGTTTIITSDAQKELEKKKAFSGSFTRVLTTAPGTQAITGVGFKPSAVMLIANVSGTSQACISVGNNGGSPTVIANDNVDIAGTWETQNTNIFMRQANTPVFSSANITSYDSDGFTLTWSKTGSPTGTATIGYIAFR